MDTTVGQLLINEGLPAPLRDYNRPLDKKNLSKLLSDVYKNHPDEYPRVVQHLQQVGQEVSHVAGLSIDIKDLKLPPAVADLRRRLAREARLMAESGKPDAESSIVRMLASQQPFVQKSLFDEALKAGNGLAVQAKIGSRGTASSLMSMLFGDMLVTDHRDRPIPVPILHSYAEGLDPVEYMAASYGARRGVMGTKFATQDAGAWGKQVAQTLHTLKASTGRPKPNTWSMLPADEPDLVGYVLARDVGKYKAGTIITHDIAADLADTVENVPVHSAIEALDDDGQIPNVGTGLRERGGLAPDGERVGMLAAQALSERLSQMQLSSKHAGGTLGSGTPVGSFELINNLVQVPKHFRGAAVLASEDGVVTKIEPAPQGGHYLLIGSTKHYVSPTQTQMVKLGDSVEAGDPLTDGFPNPAELVAHKGIGEGRRLFTKYFLEAYRGAGQPAHRRNVELLARGLINTVRVKELDAIPGALPDDTLEYDQLAARYEPRDGTQKLNPKASVGKYLERPAMHLSIGTRITPRTAAELATAGVDELEVHTDPPPFEPLVKRAMESVSISDDWLTRFGGSYQERSALEAVHRGRTSDTSGDKSYIPAIVAGNL